MPTYTSRTLAVLPTTLLSSKTLREIKQALDSVKPHHSSLEGGWASTSDDRSNLKSYGVAPPVSDVEIIPAAGPYPDRILARYYFFSHDAAVERFNPSSNPLDQHFVDAVDVVISQTVAGRYLVAWSTGSSDRIPGGAFESLDEIMRALDSTAASSDVSPIAFSSGDFFLWLTSRLRNRTQLDPSTDLLAIRGIYTEDQASRPTVLQSTVDFLRGGFLTAVAEGQRLGPAKVTFRETSMQAKLDVNLKLNGGFSINTSSTHYRTIVDKRELRFRALFDMLYVFVPKFQFLFENDASWPTPDRDDLLQEVRTELRGRY